MAGISRTEMTLEDFLNLPESNQIVQLIHGEVIMSPSPTDLHQVLVAAIFSYLKQIIPGGSLRLAPLDVLIDGANVVQPDVFWISEANDHCLLVDGKYWQGAPDLIVEVLSPGTAKLDVGDKFDLYEQYGVREYWLVDAQALFVQVFQRQNDHFARQGVFDKSGSFASVALGGLTVPVDKLLE